MVIDVLPELKPVYAVLDCGTTKLPCNFEFLLCETSELTVLLSSQHKFPSKSRMKQEFEREKTFKKEYVPIEKIMVEEGNNVSRRPGSVVVAEAPREKRQFVNFNKHCEIEKDFTKVYITLLSLKGGSIKIKHEYIKKEKNKEVQEEAPVDNSDIDAVLKNLEDWYKVEVVKLPSYINMMQRQLNFKELNKTERLLQCYPGNLAYEN